jgi:plasmid stability protein
MRDVTVSLPDEVYWAAKVRAAREGSSLSAVVADHLCALGRREAEFSRLEALQAQVLDEIERFSAGERLTREEICDRAVR